MKIKSEGDGSQTATSIDMYKLYTIKSCKYSKRGMTMS